MKFNNSLNVIMAKKLANVRGYDKMPEGYYLGKLLDEGGEATNEELILVGKEITNFYENKIKTLEKQLEFYNRKKDKEFKDFIIEKIRDKFREMQNESKEDEVGGSIEDIFVKVKSQGYWEKSFWFDYEIDFCGDIIKGTYN